MCVFFTKLRQFCTLSVCLSVCLSVGANWCKKRESESWQSVNVAGQFSPHSLVRLASARLVMLPVVVCAVCSVCVGLCSAYSNHDYCAVGSEKKRKHTQTHRELITHSQAAAAAADTRLMRQSLCVPTTPALCVCVRVCWPPQLCSLTWLTHTHTHSQR